MYFVQIHDIYMLLPRYFSCLACNTTLSCNLSKVTPHTTYSKRTRYFKCVLGEDVHHYMWHFHSK